MPAMHNAQTKWRVWLGRAAAAGKSRVLLCAWLAGILLVTGCTTRFFYERLDWFIVWQIGSYVSLSEVQEKELQQDIQAYLDQVRVEEMPEAEAFLRDVAKQVEAEEMTAEAIDLRYHEVMGWSEEAIYGIVPLSSRFLYNLSDAQVEELIESFQQTNDEMYEEYSGRTAEEREKNRNKSAIKSIEGFTGRLSTEQKQIIKDHLARMADSSEQWIQYQREWQEKFRELLLHRPPEAEFTERLTQLFVYPRSFHPPEYRAAVEGNRRIFNSMMAELLLSLTDKQKKRMLKELEDYARLLDRLAALPS